MLYSSIGNNSCYYYNCRRFIAKKPIMNSLWFPSKNSQLVTYTHTYIRCTRRPGKKSFNRICCCFAITIWIGKALKVL